MHLRILTLTYILINIVLQVISSWVLISRVISQLNTKLCYFITLLLPLLIRSIILLGTLCKLLSFFFILMIQTVNTQLNIIATHLPIVLHILEPTKFVELTILLNSLSSPNLSLRWRDGNTFLPAT